MPDRGSACELVNEYGTCMGVLDCLPGDTALQCSGQVPSIEVCNYLDDDCDGQQDEDDLDLYTSCTEGIGACLRYGFRECSQDGLGTTCTADAGMPTLETCNGLDDDCNGVMDDPFSDLGQVCTEGVGICAANGLIVCTEDGLDTSCSAVVGDPAESDACDGVDDDCDGEIDEAYPDLGDICTAGQGACQAAGTRVCTTDGAATICNAEPAAPGVEICNYFDDNCDGQADEDFTTLYDPCSVGLGSCERFGFHVCTEDALGTVCNAVPAEAGSESCNGLDDNCDGATDEDFPELGQICTAGSGACQNTGLVICDGLGTGTQCSASGGTGDPEACDGLDNDCNGLTDEDFPELGTVCTVGSGTCTQVGMWVCTQDTTAVSCSATPLPPGAELCNGIDDDCSGAIDDNLPPAPTCAKQEGVCADALQVCGGLSGWRPCTGIEYGDDYQPTELTCDGLDNDCDGEVDGDLFEPPCSQQQGVCSGAAKTCGGAEGWTECGAEEYGAQWEPEEATCDGLDND
ncbi:MAG: MopE-related protein, partial [Myxococcota bacterium]|nr:MopE-related protein [Myxococcota bacterium]